jgi:hypothetical protein
MLILFLVLKFVIRFLCLLFLNNLFLIVTFFFFCTSISVGGSDFSVKNASVSMMNLTKLNLLFCFSLDFLYFVEFQGSAI